LSNNNIAPIEAAAAQFAIKVTQAPYRNRQEIERAIEAFAMEPDGGLIILPPSPPFTDRELINRVAIGHRLPTIYFDKLFAVEGGLMSYGPGLSELYGRSGPPYVDRILRGAKPGDLPVQFPTKFQLVVNLKTAKAMRLTIPESFLNLEADEVIE